MKQNQIQESGISPVANDEQLTVEYWRKRFQELKSNFSDIIDMAEQIGTVEPLYNGIRGYLRLENVNRKRASLQYTSKAVRAAEKVLNLRQAVK